MIIDLDVLAAQTDGDHDLQSELLALFAVQLDDARQCIGVVADVEAARELLHRLKGSSRAIGANALGDRIERIERGMDESRDLMPFYAERDRLRNLLREASVYATSLIAAQVPPDLAKRQENG